MHPLVRKGFNKLIIRAKELTGYDISYVQHVKRQRYVRVRAAISCVLIKRLGAKLVNLAELMDLDETTIKNMRDSHKTRYWKDEEYVNIYDQLDQFIQAFKTEAEQRANFCE